VLEVIGDRWSLLVVTAMTNGARRFGEIEAAVEGVSQKVLTETLRRLERNGLLDRHDLGRPGSKHVEYRLTELTTTLLPLVREMGRWSQDHLVEVLRARARFDQSSPPA
jgi:DNA-binding HxlR family transcriptional regulator